MDHKKDEIFDVETESRNLKKLVATYDPETFIPDLAALITYNGVGRIEIYPFQGLDAPLKQLSYLASLNLTAANEEITDFEVPSNEEWRAIVKGTIKTKAGYYDLFLPNEDDDQTEYYRFYKLALPTFMDYYSTGLLNYEEQIINKIAGTFDLFNPEIEEKFQLKTEDFISVYNAIDRVLADILNYHTLISGEPEVRDYFDQQRKEETHPHEFVYDGANNHIRQMIKFLQGRGERQKIRIEDVYQYYDKDKVDTFFKLFNIQRHETEFLYYTQRSPILRQPIYQMRDGRYLIFEIKQLIQAVFDLLDDFLSNKANRLDDRYFKHRGKYLHKKTHQVLDRFFKKEAFIYNEYRTRPKGDGQDLLLLHKGRALITEIKAGYEAKPHSVPKDARKVFEGLYLNFKKNIQKGYDQAHRIMCLFLNKQDFDIYDENDKFLYRVNTRKYEDFFSLIVTADKFRRPQIDLSHQLKLKDDGIFPWSVCIDDLEIILLTLRKLKKGPADLFRLLLLREQLHGRIDCNDELEICGLLINDKDFKIPENEKIHLRTNPEMGLFYDDLYETGLGLENEKHYKLKKERKVLSVDPGKYYMEKARAEKRY